MCIYVCMYICMYVCVYTEDVDDLRPAVCGLELQRLGVPRHAARSQPGTKHPSRGQDAKRCTCLGKLFAHSSMAFMDKSLDCCKSWRRRGALPPSPCNALRMLSFACLLRHVDSAQRFRQRLLLLTRVRVVRVLATTLVAHVLLRLAHFV